MNAQHIELEDYNTIVTDKEIKEGDLYFNFKSNKLYVCNDIELLYDGINKKAIASTNPEHDLPSINYNGLEEEFGIVDVEKLANTKANEEYSVIGNTESEYNFVKMKRGIFVNNYIHNYKKSQSLNDKKFSLEDAKHLEFLFNRLKNVHRENENYDYMIKFKEIIQSLQQPKVTDIEIEMEDASAETYGEVLGFYPKITKIV